MKNTLQYLKKNPAETAALCFLVLMLLLFLPLPYFSDLTNSQYNYLYAKHAYLHPSFFLSKEISPLYTFFAAPFAQFGVKGIFLFNILCASLSALFALRTAQHIGLRFTWLIPLILLCTPVYLLTIPGADTGIFFGAWLMWSIYLFARNKPASAAFFVSFLPFIETQGFWIILLFFSVLLITRRYKIIPHLLFGFILYSLLTYVFRNDYMLWTHLNLAFGSDDADKAVLYFSHMEIMLGIFTEVFLLCGLLFLFRIKALKSWSAPPAANLENNIAYLTEHVLIMGSFLALFLVKSWSSVSGIHNTDFSEKEFASLIPLVALLSLRGINALQQQFLSSATVRTLNITILIIALLLLSIPLTRNIYPYKRSNEEVMAEKVSQWIKANRNKYTKICFNRPAYISFLELDPVKGLDSRALQTSLSYDSIPAGSIVISESFDQLALPNYFSEHLNTQTIYFKKITSLRLFDNEQEHPGEINLQVNLFVKRR